MSRHTHYRALTIQALWIRHECFKHPMGADEFTRVYLNNLGPYERKVARQEGIPLDEGEGKEDDEKSP